MKAFKILFILLIGLISTTGLQANTPDLKKNSKTEFAKQTDVGVQFVSVTNQNDVFCVDFSNPIIQSNSDIGYVQTDKIYNITTKTSKPIAAADNPNKTREIDTGQSINKNTIIKNRNSTNLYRLSRDGFSC